MKRDLCSLGLIWRKGSEETSINPHRYSVISSFLVHVFILTTKGRTWDPITCWGGVTQVKETRLVSVLTLGRLFLLRDPLLYPCSVFLGPRDPPVYLVSTEGGTGPDYVSFRLWKREIRWHKSPQRKCLPSAKWFYYVEERRKTRRGCADTIKTS